MTCLENRVEVQFTTGELVNGKECETCVQVLLTKAQAGQVVEGWWGAGGLETSLRP